MPKQQGVPIRWLLPRHDMPRVIEVENKCFLNDRWTENDFLSAMRTMTGVGVVAEVLGEIAGFCIYVANPNHYLIANLAVDPAYQRQGVGGALVQHLQAKLLPSQRTHIEVEFSEYNLPGQLFFRAQGFKYIDKEKNDPVLGHDLYRLRYQLPAADERSYRDALWEDAWPL